MCGGVSVDWDSGRMQTIMKGKHKCVCVWAYWWFRGSEIGLHTGLSVCIMV